MVDRELSDNRHSMSNEQFLRKLKAALPLGRSEWLQSKLALCYGQIKCYNKKAQQLNASPPPQ
ncbi:hypothetical protein EYF80_001905 [Liparis tanakae]|uniref:Uncharacterized protein n=1 Tax=Liparis tanakae TaxID=230148 RepID=A0A4Z2JD51_9TELE|nr:hypothetical protein EYF80_001905 [Liparis tanakae]